MAGNPNYSGAAAFAVGMTMRDEWPMLWSEALPLLTMIKAKSGKTNFNKARQMEGIWAILKTNFQGPVTGTTLETSTNFGVAQTPEATQGFSQLQYPYATRSKGIWYNIQEYQELVSGQTRIADIVPAKTMQMMYQFAFDWTTSLYGTQQGTGFAGNGDLTGLQYFMSTSNSPGNMSQSTYSVWQAGVNSTGGSIGDALITTETARIRALGRKKADVLLLSYQTGNNLYDKLFSQAKSTQIVTQQGEHVDFGFSSFTWNGLECVMDKPLGDAYTTSGSFMVISTPTFWVNMPTPEPKRITQNGQQRLPGTTALEDFYYMKMMIGNNDLACNSWVKAVT